MQQSLKHLLNAVVSFSTVKENLLSLEQGDLHHDEESFECREANHFTAQADEKHVMKENRYLERTVVITAYNPNVSQNFRQF